MLVNKLAHYITFASIYSPSCALCGITCLLGRSEFKDGKHFGKHIFNIFAFNKGHFWKQIKLKPEKW